MANGCRHSICAIRASTRPPSFTGTSAPPQLVEQAVRRGEGLLAKDGPLVVATGKHTGRSANDKFIVRDAETESTIWWDNNKSMTPDHFAALKADFLAALAAKDTLFVAGPLRRLAARAPGPRPGDQRARLAQPVHPHPAGPPGARTSCAGFEPEFTIIDLPSFRADPGPPRHPLGDGDRGQPHREADPDRRHRLCRRDEEVGVRHPQLSAAARRA